MRLSMLPALGTTIRNGNVVTDSFWHLEAILSEPDTDFIRNPDGYFQTGPDSPEPASH